MGISTKLNPWSNPIDQNALHLPKLRYYKIVSCKMEISCKQPNNK